MQSFAPTNDKPVIIIILLQVAFMLLVPTSNAEARTCKKNKKGMCQTFLDDEADRLEAVQRSNRRQAKKRSKCQSSKCMQTKVRMLYMEVVRTACPKGKCEKGSKKLLAKLHKQYKRIERKLDARKNDYRWISARLFRLKREYKAFIRAQQQHKCNGTKDQLQGKLVLALGSLVTALKARTSPPPAQPASPASNTNNNVFQAFVNVDVRVYIVFVIVLLLLGVFIYAGVSVKFTIKFRGMIPPTTMQAKLAQLDQEYQGRISDMSRRLEQQAANHAAEVATLRGDVALKESEGQLNVARANLQHTTKQLGATQQRLSKWEDRQSRWIESAVLTGEMTLSASLGNDTQAQEPTSEPSNGVHNGATEPMQRSNEA